jgi:hypothetical protein
VRAGGVGRMRNDERLKPASNGERSQLVSGGAHRPRALPAELVPLHEWGLALNQAILGADICFGLEPYVAAFDRFYADEVEIRNNDNPPVKGKLANRQMLASFLLPIHVAVEVGAATLHSFEMEESWIEPDGSGISNWLVDVAGPVDSGRRTLQWTTKRRWERGQVVYEQHVERQGPRLVHKRQPE